MTKSTQTVLGQFCFCAGMTAKTDQQKMTQVNFQNIPPSSASLSTPPVVGGKKWISNEKHGNRVGFAEDKGDQFTWKILTDDTRMVLIWSSVCSATCTSTNKRLTPLHGEGQKTDLTSNSFVYNATSPLEDSGLM